MADSELKIFISYSWSNSLQRDYLVSRLRDAGYEPFVDEGEIDFGAELNKTLVYQLATSDVLVAILTKESLNSKAVHQFVEATE